MLTVLIRTVIIYFAAVFSLRFMGKRQVGEMQLSELTTAVLLSELLAAPAVNPDTPLLYGIVPLCALVSLEVMVSFIITKSRLASNIFDNRPSIIIEHGVIVQKELKKLRFSVAELMSELRQNNIAELSEVDYAILEPNGKISVFPKDGSKQVTKADLSLKNSGGGIGFAVVCDGKLCKEAIAAAGTNEKKIMSEISSKKLKLSDVFFMSMGGASGTIIVKKEKKKKK